MSAVTFVVAGLPAPQGSKDYVGHRGGKAKLVESSKALAPWRQAIAIRSHNAMVRQHLRPFTGAVRVRIEFVMPRPQRCPLPTPPATKRPDLDKLARGVLDGITSTVIADDSLVIDLHGVKRTAEPGEPTGAVITVTEIA
jgi:crossover junction endodeoxyribonuclease RusA